MAWSSLAFALASLAPVPQSEPKRPHIVLVMADDFGFSDLGCYGSEIATPNLDALAAGGLRFTQFYNTGRCCSTRASLLTGLYPHQAGIGHMVNDRGHDGYRGDLNDRCVTIAEVLRSAGYRTAMVGKWHVTKFIAKDGPKAGWPRQRGFDEFFGTIHGAGSYFAPNTLTEDNTHVDGVPDDFHYTDAIGERAAAIVRRHGDETPLFLYVAFTAPHWPLHAREADVAAQRGRYDGGWDELRRSRLAKQLEFEILPEGTALTPRDRGEPAWDDAADRAWQARRMEVYAAQVAAMDRAVGTLRAALAESGKLANTLFLFLADNGGCAEEISAGWGNSASIPKTTRDGRAVRRGNDPKDAPGPEDTYQSYGRAWANASNTPFRRYKHWVHEGGIASPLIVHWPAGIAARGELRREPAHLIDVMPTCVALAGARYPTAVGGKTIQPMEGASLLPVFEDDALAPRDLYFEHEGNRAVRRGPWKLVAAGEHGPFELYDMRTDRTEQHDLAAREPARAAELAAAWQAWAERSAVLPLDPKPAVKLSTATRFVLQHGDALAHGAAPDVGGHAFAFTLRARIDGDGVLVAHGGSTHGWVLFVQDGHLHFALRVGGRLTDCASVAGLPTGEVALRGQLAADGTMTVQLGDTPIIAGRAPSILRQQPQDGLEVGRDDGGAVGRYPVPFALQGTVHELVITR